MSGIEPPAGYAAWINAPREVPATKPSFVMNTPGPPKNVPQSHGHIAHAGVWTHILGMPEMTKDLACAKEQLANGRSVFYLTLTNDHLPRTQSLHDQAVQWDRLELALGSKLRFIGQPGKFKHDGDRKIQFCRQSEGLFNRTGNPLHRFALPCRAPGATREAYAALIAEQRAMDGPKPIWLTRWVATGGQVLAMGNGIALRTNKDLESPTHLVKQKKMLMRYLDPPLIHHNTHLGRAVAVRCELRVFGLVQWEPLRVWVSRHGFTRSGSPTHNYSTSIAFTHANRHMWNINPAVDAVCENAREKAHIRACDCAMTGDTIDSAHGEAGFSTTGTHKTVAHIARRAGLAPSAIFRNVDDTVTRSLIADQEYFQAQLRASSHAVGSSLAHWNSPFVADVGLGADGRVYLYELDLRGLSWKSAGHYPHPDVDRAQAFGIYGSLALPMASALMKPSLDDHHRALINQKLSSAAGKADADTADPELLLTFLRDQGLAAALGFRRAWPSPRAVSFKQLASLRDLKFARGLQRLGLLLSSLDAESTEPLPAQAWGLWEELMVAETQPLPFRTPQQWSFLYKNTTLSKQYAYPRCKQHDAMIHSYEDTP